MPPLPSHIAFSLGFGPVLPFGLYYQGLIADLDGDLVLPKARGLHLDQVMGPIVTDVTAARREPDGLKVISSNPNWKLFNSLSISCSMLMGPQWLVVARLRSFSSLAAIEPPFFLDNWGFTTH